MVLIGSGEVLHEVAKVVRKLNILACGVLAVSVIYQELIVPLEHSIQAQAVAYIFAPSIFMAYQHLVPLRTVLIFESDLNVDQERFVPITCELP